MAKTIELGDEVRSIVTGMTGIAMARCEHLTKCAQILVQPPIDKDGKHQDGWYIDEDVLEVATPGKIKMRERPAADKPGGPMTRAPR